MLPQWTNSIRVLIAALAVILPSYVVILLAYGASPRATAVGYQPVQPIAFSHALHAGELGMDCRYCHTVVENSARAAIPPTKVCMNCHQNILGQSNKLALLRESYATGRAVEWVRVHDLPDFAYFNHSAHVRRGVGCVTCHGRVDKMDESGVFQVKTLSMGWCLECHRNPDPHLRPLDEITNMEFEPADGDPMALGRRLRDELQLHPANECSTCHR
jgi:hypothetical protein